MSTLDNLRKAAKRWLKALRANEAEALERLKRAYPGAPDPPALRHVQHALAREHGHESWTALTGWAADVSSRRRGDSGPPVTALLEAAGKGDVSRVTEILDRHPEIVNERGELPANAGHRTALHFGVGHEPIVRVLLERGANPNIRDDGDNAMPLHFAAENQDFGVIRLLIEHGADPNGEGDGHELAVIGWASCWDYREANKEIVEYLIAHGARHHIFSAVTMGETDIVRALVAESPANLQRRMDGTNRRRTPLHLAVVKKQRTSVEALLDLGADTDAVDQAGLTPLDQAALNGDVPLAQLLIDRGSRITLPAAIGLQRTRDIDRLVADEPDCLKPGQRYGTLIVRAAERSPGHIIETLVRAGASVDAQDDPSTSIDRTRGYTPLHAAAWTGNRDAAAALLKHGASVTVREDKYCATPAGWANYAGHHDVRDLILEGNIDIFDAIDLDLPHRLPEICRRDPGAIGRAFREYATCAPTRAWFTPLVEAVANDKVEAARYLLGAGADLTVAPDGRTLLDIAREHGHEAVANVLTAYAGASDDAAGTHEEQVAALGPYEGLANDLVIAYDSGEPAATVRLQDHYKRSFTWDELRAAVRQRLGSVPDSERPAGHFALPHARLLLAREAGYKDWPTFAKHLGESTGGDESAAVWRRAEQAVIAGDVTTLEQLLREHGPLFRDARPPEGPGGLSPDYSVADARSVLVRNHHFENWDQVAAFMDARARTDSPVARFEAAADAVVSGDVTTLERLLREHPDLVRARSTRTHHSTLLHYVSTNGVEYFRQKPSPNAVKVAEALLEAGAEVDAMADMYGGSATAFGLAATSLHLWLAGVVDPLMDVLLDHGAAIDPPSGGGSTVNGCLANGRPWAAEFLAGRGARLDLEGAAGVGRLDLVRSFFNEDGCVKAPATHAQMKDGFAWACEFGRADVVDFLLQRGMDVGARLRHHGQTGLHWAAAGAHVETVKVLLDHKALVDAKDETWGGTPLQWALFGWGNPAPGSALERYYRTVELLVAAGAAVAPESQADERVRADARMLAALAGGGRQ